jgi:hypothetical protein
MMNKKPYGVHVIVDPSFGDRLRDMPIGEPVWIAATEINVLAYNATGKERQPKSYLEGLSSFRVDKDGSPEDWLISEIQTIDLHHGEMSHDPPWSMINVIGVKWSLRIQEELERFGFNRHKDTTEGFTAWR